VAEWLARYRAGVFAARRREAARPFLIICRGRPTQRLTPRAQIIWPGTPSKATALGLGLSRPARSAAIRTSPGSNGRAISIVSGQNPMLGARAGMSPKGALWRHSAAGIDFDRYTQRRQMRAGGLRSGTQGDRAGGFPVLDPGDQLRPRRQTPQARSPRRSSKIGTTLEWERERGMLARRAMLPEPFRSGYRFVLRLMVLVPIAVEGRQLLGWNGWACAPRAI